MNRAGRGWWVAPLTLVLSLWLAVFPLPDAVDGFRPLFPLLVLFYWAQALPGRYGTWTGLVAGLLLDVLRDVPLGMHAFALALAGFAGSHLSARLKVYPVMHQLLAFGLVAGVYLVSLRILGNLAGITTMPLLPWLLPAVPTILLWPWTQTALNRLRRVFGVN